MSRTEIFYNISNSLSFIPLLFFKRIGKNTYQASDKIKIVLREKSLDPFFLWSFFGRKNEMDIRQGDVVLDIGAQIGPFTLFAANAAKNGLVLAFEPEPENFRLLEKNIKINRLGNVKAFRQAVTSHNDKVNLYLSKSNSGGHSIFRVDGNKKIQVPSISLEKIITRNKIRKFNFVKINAEGAEFEIILNAPKEVFEKIDKLLIECHDFLSKEDHELLLTRLIKEGYRVKEKGFWFGIGMGSIAAEKPTVRLI